MSLSQSSPYEPPIRRVWFGAPRTQLRLRRVLVLSMLAVPFVLATMPLGAQITPRSTRAVIIPIRGEITDVLHGSIERRVTEARSQGARTIIFEMDTPGGLVTSALNICRLIKNLPADIQTVAWVHHEAYSAGAMISVACKRIIMSPASSIGDCAPIMVSPTGGLEDLKPTERAKAESPVLQEFRDSAARNGYDPLICRAMVTVGEEVWWIENIASKAKRFVSGDEKKQLIDDMASDKREWRLVETFDEPITKSAVRVEQPIDRKDALLTLSQSEAVGFGLASGIASSAEEIAGVLDLPSPPSALDISGWEAFAMWLNSPIVRGILLVIAVLGGYVEFHTPGVIIPGITALIALAIFLAAPYAAGLADAWTIIVLIIGLALLAVELFIIPGFGVIGIVGGSLIVVSLIGTFVPREPGASPLSLPDLPMTWDGIKTGVFVITGSLFIASMGILLIIRYLPDLPVGRRLVLDTPSAEGASMPDPFGHLAQPGDVGVVISDLRPGGRARFGQEVLDVQSQGDYVSAGQKVQVLKREGPAIVVRPLGDQA